MTIDPRSLTAEERAIVDALFFKSGTGSYPIPSDKGHAARIYGQAFRDSEPIILARRALFAGPEKEEPEPKVCPNCGKLTGKPHAECDYSGIPYWTCARPEPASEGAKVECPNCGCRMVKPHWSSMGLTCTCKPTQPEPAATVAIDELDDRHMRMASPEAQARFKAMAGIVDVEMNHLVGVATKPAAAGEMPEAVRDAVEDLREWASAFRDELSASEYDKTLRIADALETFWRSQPAQGVRLEKVRSLIRSVRRSAEYSDLMTLAVEAQAELDRVEGR